MSSERNDSKIELWGVTKCKRNSIIQSSSNTNKARNKQSRKVIITRRKDGLFTTYITMSMMNKTNIHILTWERTNIKK